MKRYSVQMTGATTAQRWVTVAERATRKNALAVYVEWDRTHGCDHEVVLVDNKTGERVTATQTTQGSK